MKQTHPFFGEILSRVLGTPSFVLPALDPILIGEVLSLIGELKAQGMTMMIATHEMGFAKRVADQVLFLHHGQIKEVGSPAELLERPQTPECQAFLGALRDAGRL